MEQPPSDIQCLFYRPVLISALSDSLMREICKEYKDVYYIKPDAALHNGESSTADGVHPNDHGYSLWEESIEKPILKILKKYYKDIVIPKR